MDSQSSLKKLFSLHQFGIKLGLDSTLNILVQLGNPHQELKCFHIAGSNGKGSTASFIASILMELGYKVGLYTSPHFIRFNERIRINSIEIDNDYIYDFINKMNTYIEENKPTFFEVTTAMAFRYFADMKVDYAVMETGLGGRLDSTNVLDPIASIITSISLEHTEILGETIKQIAFEKCGIIKKSKPVFVGFVPKEAESVIINKSDEMGNNCFKAKDFITKEKDYVKVKCKDSTFNLYSNPLIGFHQLLNAGLAVKTVSESLQIDDGLILHKGIMNVLTNTNLQGRYEIYSEKPLIIFDSAHNPESVETFLNQFKTEIDRYDNRVLIFGAMRDKNILAMLQLLYPFFTKIFVSKPDIERAATFKEISGIADENQIKVEFLADPSYYLLNFKTENENDCLVVLGSMYLLAEIKSKIF